MYAIDELQKKINGEMVTTFAREVIEGHTQLEVEAGTTGFKGLGRKAGGRTYLSVYFHTGDFYVSPMKDDDGNTAGVTIACCGDDGLGAISKMLTFCKKVMEDQSLELNND